MSDKLFFEGKISDFIEKKFSLSLPSGSVVFSAFIHSSYKNSFPDDTRDYERLEFLGDSLIQFVISNELFNSGYSLAEMSSALKKIVQAKSLVYTAKKIGLEDCIVLGKSCKNVTDSIIEDVYESFLASVYLEFGYATAEKIIKDTLWVSFLNSELNFSTDFKTKLQEKVLKKYKVYPEYKKISITKNEEGSSIFTVGVFWDSAMKAQGTANRLKSAEKIAAKLAFQKYFYDSASS